MRKDFSDWLRQKQDIHHRNARPHVSEHEVWFCALGVNVGFEQDGKGESYLRPVVAVRKFNNEIFWGVPLIRRLKDGPFYFTFTLQGDAPSNVILSQIRLIDAKRARYKVGVMSQTDFRACMKKLKGLLP